MKLKNIFYGGMVSKETGFNKIARSDRTGIVARLKANKGRSKAHWNERV
jgi:hypothetical protein